MKQWPFRCPCGGTYEPRNIEIRLTPRGSSEAVVLEPILQGACPLCGSRVYRVSDLHRIEATMKAWGVPPP